MIKTVSFKKHGIPVNFELDDDSIWQRMVEHVDFYEHWLLNAIHKDPQLRGGVWLDVGANFGNHSVFFELFCGGTVHAFEPVPYNLEFLKKNKLNNKCNFTIHPVAVGEKPGRGSFNFGGVGRWSQCKVVTAGEGDFDIITIDQLRLQNVRVIKVDVEGFEFQVVWGALETIAEYKPDLFIEAWTNEERDRLLALLVPHGYKIIERYNDAPTFHFSTRNLPVTYTE